MYKTLNYITQFFDRKTVMEVCNKKSQPSVVTTIKKRSYFLRLNLRLKGLLQNRLLLWNLKILIC